MSKILIAGDFCPNGRVTKLLERRDYDKVLSDVRKVTSSVDYSIVNFECAVVTGQETSIQKAGPNLSCDETGIDSLEWAGFNCLTLANNHFYDFGDKGVENTIAACHYHHLDYMGGGMNIKEASSIFYKAIKNQRFAFINCCEHEFSIATDHFGGSNPLNPITQYYAIREAKEKADFVIVIVHGGLEHLQVPSVRMKELYHFFIDVGADVIINHHQHCFCGMEKYRDRFIFYGLGNFCFDWEGKRHSMWNEGYMVKLDFNETIQYEIVPYKQCDNTPCVSLTGIDTESFEKRFRVLSEVILDNNQLKEKNTAFAMENIQRYKMIFEPYSGKIGFGLYFRNLLPSFVSKNVKTKINFIECEAHREALIEVLKSL